MSHPLAGVSVLVTRPRAQASALEKPLRELGAETYLLPAIEVAPPLDPAALDRALEELPSFDWVVFTSVNGVAAVRERMQERGLDPDALSSRRVAAIGSATASALRSYLREPDLVPAEYVAEAIGEAIAEVAGRRFLLPRADIARPHLADALRTRGAKVREVAAYRVIPARDEARLPEREPDFIALTSSSAARATSDRLEAAGKGEWMRRSRLACIGPITAETVRELGCEPAVVARTYTIPGLVDALVDAVSAQGARRG